MRFIYYAFAVFLLFFFVRFLLYENRALTNVQNCKKVDIDMTTQQVIQIMGEPENIKVYRARMNYEDVDVIRYYYSAPSGSSDGVDIYFDVQTEKVIKTVCDSGFEK